MDVQNNHTCKKGEFRHVHCITLHGKNKPEIVRRFFKEWKIGQLLREARIVKEKGVSVLRIFEFVFLLVFQNTILFRAFEQDVEKKLGFAKDTVYRFLESVSGNWERFLLSLSASIIEKKVSPLSRIQDADPGLD